MLAGGRYKDLNPLRLFLEWFILTVGEKYGKKVLLHRQSKTKKGDLLHATYFYVLNAALVSFALEVSE